MHLWLLWIKSQILLIRYFYLSAKSAGMTLAAFHIGTNLQWLFFKTILYSSIRQFMERFAYTLARRPRSDRFHKNLFFRNGRNSCDVQGGTAQIYPSYCLVGTKPAQNNTGMYSIIVNLIFEGKTLDHYKIVQLITVQRW